MTTRARVLLVEDSYLAATSIAAEIERANCDVVGPYASVALAIEAAQRDEFDLAILDINLADGSSLPIAETVARRERPIIVISGYSQLSVLPDQLANCRTLRKPVIPGAIARAIAACLGDEQCAARDDP